MLILRPWESFADGAIWVRRDLKGRLVGHVYLNDDDDLVCVEPFSKITAFQDQNVDWCKGLVDRSIQIFRSAWHEATPEELAELDPVTKGRTNENPENSYIEAVNEQLQSDVNQLAADAIIEALSPEALWKLGQRMKGLGII
jgi:hypothetical protein